MLVSKPPEARRKPEGIGEAAHLEVRAQGFPGTEIAKRRKSH